MCKKYSFKGVSGPLCNHCGCQNPDRGDICPNCGKNPFSRPEDEQDNYGRETMSLDQANIAAINNRTLK
jgi:hypothetical protein